MFFDIDVQRRFGNVRLGAQFESAAGITALVGRSGAGKSTILNMIAGLVRPDRGRIVVGGRTLFDGQTNVAVHRRQAGYIFQDGRLFPHMKVRSNLRYGSRRSNGPAMIGEDELIAFLGLEQLLDRWPASLSGGEARRVAIGRTLLSGARFLLMDEPLVSLDEERREEVLRTIERIRDELHVPILYVSHDSGEIDRLAGKSVPIEPQLVS